MNVSGATIKLVFLLTPGIIGTFLFRSMRGRRKRANWEMLLQVFLFALASYVAYFVLFFWFPHGVLRLAPAPVPPGAARGPILLAEFFSTFTNGNVEIPWTIVWGAVAISVLLSVAASYCDTYKVFPKFCRWIRVSNCTGEEDLWEFFFDSGDSRFVLVRDHKINLAYYGKVRAFSDAISIRELILLDVDVYNNESGDFLYNAPVMYISRHADDLTVEIPRLDDNNTRGRDDSQEVANGTQIQI